MVRLSWLFATALGALSILSFSLAVSAQQEEERSEVERAVLLEFFKETGGLSWNNNNGWIENSADYCLWHGVICVGEDRLPDDIEQRRQRQRRQLQVEDGLYFIIGLDLGNNDLVGRTPDAVWNLPALKYVDFSFNTDLDVSFAALENAISIETIKLHDTATSTITGISAAAETLHSFHVSGAPLNSNLPAELFSLTSLKFLHMVRTKTAL